MITPDQIDFLERDLDSELRETKKWMSRIQKKLYRLELVMELLLDKKSSSKKIVDFQQDLFAKEQ